MEERDKSADDMWSIDELPSQQGYYLQRNNQTCVVEVSLPLKFLSLFNV
jgi:hypothetical protein